MVTIPFSVLDLSLIARGKGPANAFQNTIHFAQLAERLDFKRYWLAEHHNMPGIASAATSILIAQVASATHHIRVGSGGIMLPNHSPLIIAEQFGTLETLFPGRIDLGLGRAPGADQQTARALRRDLHAPDRFPEDVAELLTYFEPGSMNDTHLIHAVPGMGLQVPVWILGSSLFSAVLAAHLGLPYAFASHFAPAQMAEAITLYRARFTPSARCPAPYVMLTINIIAADTDAEARRLKTSLEQYFLALRRGRPIAFPPPLESENAPWTKPEQDLLDSSLRYTYAGTPETIRHTLKDFVDLHQPQEIMVAAPIFDHSMRCQSLELTSQIKALLD
ncbi:alkane 1-monooxygenase [Acetobacter indonesiensis]|uniref:LLM class flavin-dependent oxidoreductase n=1 Tax=Acetobacter indonesiensis TaxID=104101 RepID=UPI000B72798E|nr:LLM class flavin-dependent oxidoreductase [Acetobacter indonesiensis]OUI93405.1 alkane 1-monooxygenase [Acetobacter indonesiensis]